MHEHVRDNLQRFEQRTCRIKQRAPLIHFIAKNIRSEKKRNVDDDDIKSYAARVHVKHSGANKKIMR